MSEPTPTEETAAGRTSATHTPGEQRPGAPAPQPSRYAMGSAANMVRSLLVVGGLVAVLFFMVPRVNSVSGPPVDIHSTALTVVQDTGLPIVEAVGLPKGWSATSARYVRGTDGLMTWHAGYQAPSGAYVAVEQTKDATNAWVQAQTNRAARTGTRDAGGRTWTTFVRDTKVQNSMLDRPSEPGSLATLLTGTASFEEMDLVAAHLKPVTK